MNNQSSNRTRAFVLTGLGAALLVAMLISPFASSNPDGLNRVAEDHQFDDKASADTPAQKLPFYDVFDAYALRGVPDAIATPLAGLVGTLATFGIAWGLGKLVVRGQAPNTPDLDAPDEPLN